MVSVNVNLYRLFLPLLLLMTLSGCLGWVPSSGYPDGGTGDGVIEVEIVTEAPPNATVYDYTQSGIADAKPVNVSLSRVLTSNESSATVIVPEDDVESVQDHLSDYDYYTPYREDDGKVDYEWDTGYYVQRGEVIVRFEFVILA